MVLLNLLSKSLNKPSMPARFSFLVLGLCVGTFCQTLRAQTAPKSALVEPLISVLQEDSGKNIKPLNNSRVLKCIGGKLHKTYSVEQNNLHELRHYWPTDYVYTMIHGLSDSPMTFLELVRVMCSSPRSMTIVLTRLKGHGLQTNPGRRDGFQLQWKRYPKWVQQVKNTILGAKSLGREHFHMGFSMGTLSSTLAIQELPENLKPKKLVYIEPFLSTHGHGKLSRFISFVQKIPLFPLDELLFNVQTLKEYKSKKYRYPHKYRVISPNGFAQIFKQASKLQKILEEDRPPLLGRDTELLVFHMEESNVIRPEDIEVARKLVSPGHFESSSFDSRLLTHSRVPYPFEGFEQLSDEEKEELLSSFQQLVDETRSFLGIPTE